MLGASYIRKLDGDPECIEALAWLAEHGERYKLGGFTPPLTRKRRESRQQSIVAFTLRIGRSSISAAGSRITRADMYDGSHATTLEGSVEDISGRIASAVFVRKYTGHLFVTSGKRRQALDVFLDSLGPELLRLGYSLQPWLSGGSVSCIVVRKGRYKWTLTYFETMTGVGVDTGLTYATDVGLSTGHPKRSVQSLYAAASAVAGLYLTQFGVALAPTVGMIAIGAARTHLETGFRKWRPAPLLVAMERDARGYRGGMTYARRWRGATIQVDVTRQYTFALACDLPAEWVFGRFPGFHFRGAGIYMCRVRLPNTFTYPLGIWQGPSVGFALESVQSGEYVCALHTPEIRALIASGASVWPTYGYTATSHFSFREYARHIQDILEVHGRGSAISKLTKPLGNYVYGKLGQSPRRTELMYTDQDMRPEWYPYFDEYGNEWSNVWERKVERYTASQHIDVAGYITSLARAQTLDAWQRCLDAGATVVRVHTDSLTLDHLPESFRLSNGNELGGWRIEAEYHDTIIVGPNAYADDTGVHLGGVPNPTYETLERLYDDGFAQVTRHIRKPRRGFERGSEEVTRDYVATGR